MNLPTLPPPAMTTLIAFPGREGRFWPLLG
jgi:hypothetical protein